jgi:hypothetical protein
VLILEDYLPFMLIWKKLVLDFDFGVSTKSAKIRRKYS